MMSVAVLLLAQAAAAQGSPAVAPIGRQALPTRGCAAYLWAPSTGAELLALAGSDPAQLRLRLDGKTTDLARAAQSGEGGGYGFASHTEYRDGDVTAVLDVTVAARADLTGGAMVPEGMLRIDRPGRDGMVLPIAGLIACAAGQSIR